MAKSNDSKFIPGNDESKDSAGFGNYNGMGHEFNIKGKVTNVKNSCYQDFDSGCTGNYAEKDSSIAYLDKRGKEGQECNYYTHLDYSDKTYKGAGLTAYNSSPIPETYIPATSNGVPAANAVEYNTVVKNRNKK